jgi:hypothetical protein
MSKAKSRTTPADDWRQHRARQRAKGKGRFAMPAGRYTPVKRTLRNGVVYRDRHLALTLDQADTLVQLATLVTYSDGFTYTPAMMALNRRLANIGGPNYRAAVLAEAAAREHAYVAR